MARFRQWYWNEPTQHEVKKKLEFGRYQPDKDRSRAEYATKVLAQVRELTPVPDKTEIIRNLAQYYNDELKHAIIR